MFEDLKLESRQLLSLKADEACRLMKNEAFRKDLWMWDQDWSTQTLKLKKTIPKKKSNIPEEITDNHSDNLKNRQPKVLKTLSEEYIDTIEYKPDSNNNVEDLSKEFDYLYELGKALPVKRPYLAGYPAWYRKLCTKPGKDPDWMPGANNLSTSMQVTTPITWSQDSLYCKYQGIGEHPRTRSGSAVATKW